ncbi:MAG: hypothetical protein WCK67_04960 [bacterium]
MAIPIFFIHKGLHPYLLFTIMQAKFSNPNSEIILIGDDENKVLGKYITHYNYNELINNNILELRKIYKHKSNNKKDYELFCIERWFLLNEYSKKFKLKNLFYIDSDVMLYENITQIFDKLSSVDVLCFDYEKISSGHYCYINNLTKLDNLNNYILDLYNDNNKFNELCESYLTTENSAYVKSISDMVLLHSFLRNNDITYANITNYFEGKIFTNTFNFNKVKNIVNSEKTNLISFTNNKFLVKFKDNNEILTASAIHFHGEAKHLISSYATVKLPIRLKFINLSFLLNKLYKKIKKYL